MKSKTQCFMDNSIRWFGVNHLEDSGLNGMQVWTSVRNDDTQDPTVHGEQKTDFNLKFVAKQWNECF